jgi:hypothetical protein
MEMRISENFLPDSPPASLLVVFASSGCHTAKPLHKPLTGFDPVKPPGFDPAKPPNGSVGASGEQSPEATRPAKPPIDVETRLEPEKHRGRYLLLDQIRKK